MRDYSNMPTLQWSDRTSANKAKFQILHQEPVILEMPEDFRYHLERKQAECQLHEDTGMYFDCKPRPLLDQLAELNHDPMLQAVADACQQSGSRVDIDPAGHRIIVHD